MSNKKFKLFKFGLSEHKRTDLLFSYFSAAKSINKLKGYDWTIDEEYVLKILKENNFFKMQKKETNIEREETLFKHYLKIMNIVDGKIEPTNNSLIVDNVTSYEEKDFFNFTWQEYWYIQSILKFSNNDLLDLAYVLKIGRGNIESYVDYFIVNLENTKNNLRNQIISNNLDKIKSEISLNSGIPKKMSYYNHLTVLGKEIANQYIDEVFINHQNEYSIDLLSKLSDYLSYKKLSKGYYELFFGKPEKIKNKVIKALRKKDYSSIKQMIPKTIDEKLENIFLRRIGGVYNDYKNLIFNHLNSLPGIKINQITGKIDIEKPYESLYDAIQKNIYSQDKFSSSDYIPPKKLLEILGIENNIFDDDTTLFYEIWESYYNREQIRQILEWNWKNSSGIYSLISNHTYFKGKIPPHVLYEFVIGLSIFYHDNRVALQNKTLLKPWDKLKSYFGLNFNRMLLPTGHAPGGRADIIREVGKVIELYEPTIQIYRQAGHELEGIVSHLLKVENATVSFLVAPEIGPLAVASFKGVNKHHLKEKRKKIAFMTTEDVIETFLSI